MTMQDIVQELLKDGDKYMVEREEMVPVGTEPIRKHHKRRIQKKYIKKYGLKVKYEKKKSKVIDVTLDLIVDFCQEKGLPLPDEIITMTTQNDCGGNIDA